MRIRPWLPTIVTAVVVAVMLVTQTLWASPLAAKLAGANSGTSLSTVGYQGFLTDITGSAIHGTRDMRFALYPTLTAGTALWSESQVAVPVNNGLFSVLLGDVTPIPPAVIASHQDLWLGIAVGADSEMSPRERLSSAPNALTSGQVADGSVTAAKLADGAVLSQHFQPTYKYIAAQTRQDTTSTTWTNVTGMELTIDTAAGQIAVVTAHVWLAQRDTDGYPMVRILANGVEISRAQAEGGSTPGGAETYDTVPLDAVYAGPAGAVTFTMQFQSASETKRASVERRFMSAMVFGH